MVNFLCLLDCAHYMFLENEEDMVMPPGSSKIHTKCDECETIRPILLTYKTASPQKLVLYTKS